MEFKYNKSRHNIDSNQNRSNKFHPGDDDEPPPLTLHVPDDLDDFNFNNNNNSNNNGKPDKKQLDEDEIAKKYPFKNYHSSPPPSQQQLSPSTTAPAPKSISNRKNNNDDDGKTVGQLIAPSALANAASSPSPQQQHAKLPLVLSLFHETDQDESINAKNTNNINGISDPYSNSQRGLPNVNSTKTMRTISNGVESKDDDYQEIGNRLENGGDRNNNNNNNNVNCLRDSDPPQQHDTISIKITNEHDEEVQVFESTVHLGGVSPAGVNRGTNINNFGLLQNAQYMSSKNNTLPNHSNNNNAENSNGGASSSLNQSNNNNGYSSFSAKPPNNGLRNTAQGSLQSVPSSALVPAFNSKHLLGNQGGAGVENVILHRDSTESEVVSGEGSQYDARIRHHGDDDDDDGTQRDAFAETKSAISSQVLTAETPIDIISRGAANEIRNNQNNNNSKMNNPFIYEGPELLPHQQVILLQGQNPINQQQQQGGNNYSQYLLNNSSMYQSGPNTGHGNQEHYAGLLASRPSGAGDGNGRISIPGLIAGEGDAAGLGVKGGGGLARSATPPLQNSVTAKYYSQGGGAENYFASMSTNTAVTGGNVGGGGGGSNVLKMLVPGGAVISNPTSSESAFSPHSANNNVSTNNNDVNRNSDDIIKTLASDEQNNKHQIQNQDNNNNNPQKYELPPFRASEYQVRAVAIDPVVEMNTIENSNKAPMAIMAHDITSLQHHSSSENSNHNNNNNNQQTTSSSSSSQQQKQQQQHQQKNNSFQESTVNQNNSNNSKLQQMFPSNNPSHNVSHASPLLNGVASSFSSHAGSSATGQQQQQNNNNNNNNNNNVRHIFSESINHQRNNNLVNKNNDDENHQYPSLGNVVIAAENTTSNEFGSKNVSKENFFRSTPAGGESQAQHQRQQQKQNNNNNSNNASNNTFGPNNNNNFVTLLPTPRQNNNNNNDDAVVVLYTSQNNQSNQSSNVNNINPNGKLLLQLHQASVSLASNTKLSSLAIQQHQQQQQHPTDNNHSNINLALFANSLVSAHVTDLTNNNTNINVVSNNINTNNNNNNNNNNNTSNEKPPQNQVAVPEDVTILNSLGKQVVLPFSYFQTNKFYICPETHNNSNNNDDQNVLLAGINNKNNFHRANQNHSNNRGNKNNNNNANNKNNNNNNNMMMTPTATAIQKENGLVSNPENDYYPNDEEEDFFAESMNRSSNNNNNNYYRRPSIVSSNNNRRKRSNSQIPAILNIQQPVALMTALVANNNNNSNNDGNAVAVEMETAEGGNDAKAGGSLLSDHTRSNKNEGLVLATSKKDDERNVSNFSAQEDIFEDDFFEREEGEDDPNNVNNNEAKRRRQLRNILLNHSNSSNSTSNQNKNGQPQRKGDEDYVLGDGVDVDDENEDADDDDYDYESDADSDNESLLGIHFKPFEENAMIQQTSTSQAGLMTTSVNPGGMFSQPDNFNNNNGHRNKNNNNNNNFDRNSTAGLSNLLFGTSVNNNNNNNNNNADRQRRRKQKLNRRKRIGGIGGGDESDASLGGHEDDDDNDHHYDDDDEYYSYYDDDDGEHAFDTEQHAAGPSAGNSFVRLSGAAKSMNIGGGDEDDDDNYDNHDDYDDDDAVSVTTRVSAGATNVVSPKTKKLTREFGRKQRNAGKAGPGQSEPGFSNALTGTSRHIVSIQKQLVAKRHQMQTARAARNHPHGNAERKSGGGAVFDDQGRVVSAALFKRSPAVASSSLAQKNLAKKSQPQPQRTHARNSNDDEYQNDEVGAGEINDNSSNKNGKNRKIKRGSEDEEEKENTDDEIVKNPRLNKNYKPKGSNSQATTTDEDSKGGFFFGLFGGGGNQLDPVAQGRREEFQLKKYQEAASWLTGKISRPRLSPEELRRLREKHMMNPQQQQKQNNDNYAKKNATTNNVNVAMNNQNNNNNNNLTSSMKAMISSPTRIKTGNENNNNNNNNNQSPSASPLKWSSVALQHQKRHSTQRSQNSSLTSHPLANANNDSAILQSSSNAIARISPRSNNIVRINMKNYHNNTRTSNAHQPNLGTSHYFTNDNDNNNKNNIINNDDASKIYKIVDEGNSKTNFGSNSLNVPIVNNSQRSSGCALSAAPLRNSNKSQQAKSISNNNSNINNDDSELMSGPSPAPATSNDQKAESRCSIPSNNNNNNKQVGTEHDESGKPSTERSSSGQSTLKQQNSGSDHVAVNNNEKVVGKKENNFGETSVNTSKSKKSAKAPLEKDEVNTQQRKKDENQSEAVGIEVVGSEVGCHGGSGDGDGGGGNGTDQTCLYRMLHFFMFSLLDEADDYGTGLMKLIAAYSLMWGPGVMLFLGYYLFLATEPDEKWLVEHEFLGPKDNRVTVSMLSFIAAATFLCGFFPAWVYCKLTTKMPWWLVSLVTFFLSLCSIVAAFCNPRFPTSAVSISFCMFLPIVFNGSLSKFMLVHIAIIFAVYVQAQFNIFFFATEPKLTLMIDVVSRGAIFPHYGPTFEGIVYVVVAFGVAVWCFPPWYFFANAVKVAKSQRASDRLLLHLSLVSISQLNFGEFSDIIRFFSSSTEAQRSILKKVKAEQERKRHQQQQQNMELVQSTFANNNNDDDEEIRTHESSIEILEFMRSIGSTVRSATFLAPLKLLESFQSRKIFDVCNLPLQLRSHVSILHIRIIDFEELVEQVLASIETFSLLMEEIDLVAREDQDEFEMASAHKNNNSNGDGGEDYHDVGASPNQANFLRQMKMLNSRKVRVQHLLNSLLTKYVDTITKRIQRHGGAILENLDGGENIVACWGAPLPCPDASIFACCCAIHLRHVVMNELAPEFRKKLAGFFDLRVSIGVSTGPVEVGNLGCTSLDLKLKEMNEEKRRLEQFKKLQQAERAKRKQRREFLSLRRKNRKNRQKSEGGSSNDYVVAMNADGENFVGNQQAEDDGEGENEEQERQRKLRKRQRHKEKQLRLKHEARRASNLTASIVADGNDNDSTGSDQPNRKKKTSSSKQQNEGDSEGSDTCSTCSSEMMTSYHVSDEILRNSNNKNNSNSHQSNEKTHQRGILPVAPPQQSHFSMRTANFARQYFSALGAPVQAARALTHLHEIHFPRPSPAEISQIQQQQEQQKKPGEVDSAAERKKIQLELSKSSVIFVSQETLYFARKKCELASECQPAGNENDFSSNNGKKRKGKNGSQNNDNNNDNKNNKLNPLRIHFDEIHSPNTRFLFASRYLGASRLEPFAEYFDVYILVGVASPLSDHVLYSSYDDVESPFINSNNNNNNENYKIMQAHKNTINGNNINNNENGAGGGGGGGRMNPHYEYDLQQKENRENRLLSNEQIEANKIAKIRAKFQDSFESLGDDDDDVADARKQDDEARRRRRLQQEQDRQALGADIILGEGGGISPNDNDEVDNDNDDDDDDGVFVVNNQETLNKNSENGDGENNNKIETKQSEQHPQENENLVKQDETQRNIQQQQQQQQQRPTNNSNNNKISNNNFKTNADMAAGSNAKNIERLATICVVKRNNNHENLHHLAGSPETDEFEPPQQSREKRSTDVSFNIENSIHNFRHGSTSASNRMIMAFAATGGGGLESEKTEGDGPNDEKNQNFSANHPARHNNISNTLDPKSNQQVHRHNHNHQRQSGIFGSKSTDWTQAVGCAVVENISGQFDPVHHEVGQQLSEENQSSPLQPQQHQQLSEELESQRHLTNNSGSPTHQNNKPTATTTATSVAAAAKTSSTINSKNSAVNNNNNNNFLNAPNNHANVNNTSNTMLAQASGFSSSQVTPGNVGLTNGSTHAYSTNTSNNNNNNNIVVPTSILLPSSTHGTNHNHHPRGMTHHHINNTRSLKRKHPHQQSQPQNNNINNNNNNNNNNFLNVSNTGKSTHNNSTNHLGSHQDFEHSSEFDFAKLEQMASVGVAPLRPNDKLVGVLVGKFTQQHSSTENSSINNNNHNTTNGDFDSRANSSLGGASGSAAATSENNNNNNMIVTSRQVLRQQQQQQQQGGGLGATTALASAQNLAISPAGTTQTRQNINNVPDIISTKPAEEEYSPKFTSTYSISNNSNNNNSNNNSNVSRNKILVRRRSQQRVSQLLAQQDSKKEGHDSGNTTVISRGTKQREGDDATAMLLALVMMEDENENNNNNNNNNDQSSTSPKNNQKNSNNNKQTNNMTTNTTNTNGSINTMGDFDESKNNDENIPRGGEGYNGDDDDDDGVQNEKFGRSASDVPAGNDENGSPLNNKQQQQQIRNSESASNETNDNKGKNLRLRNPFSHLQGGAVAANNNNNKKKPAVPAIKLNLLSSTGSNFLNASSNGNFPTSSQLQQQQHQSFRKQLHHQAMNNNKNNNNINNNNNQTYESFTSVPVSVVDEALLRAPIRVNNQKNNNNNNFFGQSGTGGEDYLSSVASNNEHLAAIARNNNNNVQNQQQQQQQQQQNFSTISGPSNNSKTKTIDVEVNDPTLENGHNANSQHPESSVNNNYNNLNNKATNYILPWKKYDEQKFFASVATLCQNNNINKHHQDDTQLQQQNQQKSATAALVSVEENKNQKQESTSSPETSTSKHDETNRAVSVKIESSTTPTKKRGGGGGVNEASSGAMSQQQQQQQGTISSGGCGCSWANMDHEYSIRLEMNLPLIAHVDATSVNATLKTWKTKTDTFKSSSGHDSVVIMMSDSGGDGAATKKFSSSSSSSQNNNDNHNDAMNGDEQQQQLQQHLINLDKDQKEKFLSQQRNPCSLLTEFEKREQTRTLHAALLFCKRHSQLDHLETDILRHINNGISLMEEGSYAEAIAEYKAVLNPLDPAWTKVLQQNGISVETTWHWISLCERNLASPPQFSKMIRDLSDYVQ